MDGLMVVLCAVTIAESMLLIAQGEEMSDKNDRIRFLMMENEELRRKGEKDGEKDGAERGDHEDQVPCNDSKGQGAGLGTGGHSESPGGVCEDP